LWPIQAALGELSLERGEEEQAWRAFKQVATILGKLTEDMEDGEVKASFLASPLIQRVFKQCSTGR
jgi:hypothetical protein